VNVFVSRDAAEIRRAALALLLDTIEETVEVRQQDGQR
jgi:hypothetical protein